MAIPVETKKPDTGTDGDAVDTPADTDPPAQSEFSRFLFENIGNLPPVVKFSNRMVAFVQDSNVLLYFGNDLPGSDANNHVRYSDCIALSHAYFMEMAQYLNARLNMLAEAYELPEHPLNLRMVAGKDPGRMKRANDILFGLTAPEIEKHDKPDS